MKKFIIFIFVLSFPIVLGSCGKKDTAGDTEKKTETAETKDKGTDKKDAEIGDNTPMHIQYKVTTAKKESEGLSAIDIYRKGKMVKSEVTTNKGKESVKAMGYMSDKTVYSITDIGGKKIGFKIDLKDFGKDGNDKNYENMLIDFKDKLKDYSKEGTEDILGYKCDIYKDKKGVKYWIYKDAAPLKVVSETSTMEATKFEPGIKLDDSFFTPPSDVDYMDAGKIDIGKLKNLNPKGN